MTRPVVWSVAGTDSGGGAGLAADQRTADAFGVHLCPVVAAVTAQHSRAVTQVVPVSAELLDAQLAALADDLPPQAVKTGLLGSAEAVATVARWVDRLRERGPVALVVDPVLGATSGAAFADAATLAAYRELLLPRATVLTPNRHEAARLAGDDDLPAADALPALARALWRRGAAAVAITGGDSPAHEGQALDWIATEHACGWLALPRLDAAHHHGSGCTFATATAAALARGHVAADALVLAKMATTHAIRHGYAAGRGVGPVHAQPGFQSDASLLPRLSWGEAPRFHVSPRPRPARPLGLYALVDSAERVRRVLATGVRTLQLRIKTEATPAVRDAIREAVADCRAAGAELFVNDHWALALELGADGVHLGQEDLLALDDERRERLAAGVALGISTHSLWELCRARSLAPRYVACGPVWPTLTKAMPWHPQGLDNLAWWVGMAGAPVVAIGGILSADRFHAAAAAGADGVCAVRVLGDDPAATVPALAAALDAGRAEAGRTARPAWPHPSLASGYGHTTR